MPAWVAPFETPSAGARASCAPLGENASARDGALRGARRVEPPTHDAGDVRASARRVDADASPAAAAPGPRHPPIGRKPIAAVDRAAGAAVPARPGVSRGGLVVGGRVAAERIG